MFTTRIPHFFATLLVVGATATGSVARAQAPSATASAGDAPAPAGSAGELPWKPGPAQIELGHQLSLALPEGDLFLAQPEAGQLLAKNGNLHNENLLGIVVPKTDDNWFVTIRYQEEGYVKDDEKVDADELLKVLREGNEELNKERVQKGFAALQIDGWSDVPRYDRAAHHLVWGLLVHSEGQGPSLNYNTRILGRRGWVAVNLVTSPELLPKFKEEGAKVRAATTFKSGARYEDFDAKTDKVADYGLVGLVLGGAGLGASKLVKVGILAKFWKVLVTAAIAGKKFIAIALVAGVALLKKLFGGRDARAEP
jgi:uncharacterized membrane-anchored protein